MIHRRGPFILLYGRRSEERGKVLERNRSVDKSLLGKGSQVEAVGPEKILRASVERGKELDHLEESKSKGLFKIMR